MFFYEKCFVLDVQFLWLLLHISWLKSLSKKLNQNTIWPDTYKTTEIELCCSTMKRHLCFIVKTNWRRAEPLVYKHSAVSLQRKILKLFYFGALYGHFPNAMGAVCVNAYEPSATKERRRLFGGGINLHGNSIDGATRLTCYRRRNNKSIGEGLAFSLFYLIVRYNSCSLV